MHETLIIVAEISLDIIKLRHLIAGTLLMSSLIQFYIHYNCYYSGSKFIACLSSFVLLK